MHRDITQAQGHEIAVSLQLLLSPSPPQKQGAVIIGSPDPMKTFIFCYSVSYQFVTAYQLS